MRAPSLLLALIVVAAAAAARAQSTPAAPAPTPTRPDADVISLFSDTYADQPVDTWSAPWDAADLAAPDPQISGDPVKLYTNLAFAGIEFWDANPPIDASASSGLHVDLWTPDATQLGIRLVDFGADAAPGGGDDTEDEVVLNGASTPALTTGTWISLDVPFTDLPLLASRQHLAQLILLALPSGSTTLYVDNVYFYRNAPAAPAVPTLGPWGAGMLFAILGLLAARSRSRS